MMLLSLPAAAFILLLWFLLSIGSLLNVVIYRLPRALKATWVSECRSLLELPDPAEKKLNLFLPRSFCPHCKTPIPIRYNIPLLGFLMLKGRCHHCKVAISWRYPSIELLTCLLSLSALHWFGLTLQGLFAVLFIAIILALFFIDYDTQLLPDSLTISLLWLGLFANTQCLFTTLPHAVFGAAGAYLFLWLFAHLFYLITHKIGMGHGDFKLFAAFGAWFGWTLLPLLLFIASITGAIIGIILLKLRNQSKDTPIAFGPFLCVAATLMLFFGKDMVHGYWQWVGM